jgi:ribosomal 50S subunit-recycling heat shock protein
MKTSMNILASLVFASSTLLAAAPKTYQVTGPVLEVTDSMIAVQKGKERWEIARDANTKVAGDLKVGAKVTIEYSMTAATVEVKADKADTKSAASAKASPAASAATSPEAKKRK